MIARGVATPKQASTNITTVIAIPATKPASSPANSAFDLLMKSMAILIIGRWQGDYFCKACGGTLGRSNAIRKNVSMIRQPATNVPRNVPETFEMPPVRQR